MITISGCSSTDEKSQNEAATQVSQFNWSKEALLRVQIDPVTLKKLDFAGDRGQGSAEVKIATDPSLVSSFAVETLPSKCAPVANLVNGSLDLGSELKLSQFSEASSDGNAFFQWVNTFPTSELAAQRFKDFMAVAPDCGLYTRINSSGESDQFKLWSTILDSSTNSIVASGSSQFFSVGYVGKAIYFQWLIFDSLDLPSNEEMSKRTQVLRDSIEALLSKVESDR